MARELNSVIFMVDFFFFFFYHESRGESRSSWASFRRHRACPRVRAHTHVPRWACGANHTETVFGLYRVRRMCRSRPLAHRRPPCSRAPTVTHRPSPAAGRSSAGRVRRTAPGRRSVLLLQRRAWARLRRGRRGLCVVPYSRVGARRDLAKSNPDAVPSPAPWPCAVRVTQGAPLHPPEAARQPAATVA